MSHAHPVSVAPGAARSGEASEADPRPTIPPGPLTGRVSDEGSAGTRKRRTAALLAEAASCRGAERDRLLGEVIVLNIPVARSLAARYRNRGQGADELEQVACLALTRAVQGFDPERGDDLLVFAVPTILGELKRHFRATSWAVRPPRRIQEIRPRLLAAADDLTQRLGHTPSADELADELGCSIAEVSEAVSCGDLSQAASLDEPVSATGSPLGELLGSEEEGFGQSEAVAMLGPACRDLKPRDRRILRMRFYEQLTQQQIAVELGVTQVQVSRLLQRIFADLRRRIDAPEEPHAA
ncbi:sigma-70 family RNA polymerase sigma factor [Nocardioides sp. zg-ZUI104]|uniref:sigma-70 family RNA polymerase sigma factor n=1 Tax=Nocardioides faecalis TaxID=2803858 RepID=UPI001BCC7944|nr:sigma-70 family RNA polymerase sigma factor [Nocardioides faecalis]MBS4751801.1 sigma-70 family RNA polymerase sigma factor [Nocardioides faecalis]